MSQHIRDRLIERACKRYREARERLEQLEIDLEDLTYLHENVDPMHRRSFAVSESADEHIQHGIDLSKYFVPSPGQHPTAVREARRRFIFKHAIRHAKNCIERTETDISECESLIEGLEDIKED